MLQGAKSKGSALLHSRIEALRAAVRSAWIADTSISRDQWSPLSPSIGQCAVTALVVQDAFGGELLRGATADMSHYWNRLPCGLELDLTDEQFIERPHFIAVEPRSREYVLSYPDTVTRYAILRRCVGKLYDFDAHRKAERLAT